ncbi:ABC transporter ATP-binding protein [Patescibacteria group bacterium]|nr:ABC transporter ATP-binding protein [Patescibacteria group bacterium]MCL5797340.1 ABC transporter ATP-binding protein [Patescibacteria group bacterium]
MLTLKQISKTYGNQEVLEQISFDLEEKEFVSIIGKSGVGKTTLLSIMAGLVSSDSGKVVFSNSDITHYSEEQLAEFRLKNIGIVFQDFKLIPSLSVYDNIYLAIYPRKDIDKDEKNKRILDLIDQVGLSGKENKCVDNLSGGEKQRVAIARSLVNRPKLVLADEPTGNLDEATSDKIMSLFESLHKKYSTTFIVVTHEKDIAKKTQKVYQLSKGMLSQMKGDKNE